MRTENFPFPSTAYAYLAQENFEMGECGKYESEAVESVAFFRSRRTPFGITRKISGKFDQKTRGVKNRRGVFRLLPYHRNV